MSVASLDTEVELDYSHELYNYVINSSCTLYIVVLGHIVRECLKFAFVLSRRLLSPDLSLS